MPLRCASPTVSDWTEFGTWCRDNHHIALPATVGFVSALRASELAALEVDQIKPHERGLVIELTHSKTNQTGDLELVVLPWGARQDYCPVTALRHWLTVAGITEGLVFRSVSKGNRVSSRGLTPDGLSRLITQAVTRAGFVTYTAKRGATSLQIAARPGTRTSPPSASTPASKTPGKKTPPPNSPCESSADLATV